MLLSTGKTLAATPINGAGGIGETRALQAHLGNNLAAATTMVSGNSNTVLDTVRTGDWKFYVASSTSIASVTGASASSEWTGGSLLSYNEVDYYMFYPFNTDAVSGNTLLNKATNSYDATLYGGASIINTVPSPAAQPPATGSGYLEMNVGAGQYAQLNQSVSLSQSGSTISVWFRWTSNILNAPIFQYGNGNDFLILYMWARDWCNIAWKNGASQNASYAFHAPSLSIPVGSWVHVAVQTSTGNIYVNGVSNGSANGFSSMPQPTYFYFGNYNPVTSNIGSLTNDFSIKTGTISMDNFVIYNKTLTVQEIGALYSKSDIYYTFDSDSVSGTSVGNKASGTYVYDATLVNSASIGTSNPSSAPTAGTGHLQVTSANNIATNQYVQLTFQPSFIGYKNSFSVSFWARSNNSTNNARCKPFDFSKPVAGGIGGNVGHSIYITGNNLWGLIFHDATGTNYSEYTMYTSPSLVSDNTWRHYVWTVQGDSGQTVEWKFYVNSVLVFTQTGGFTNGGAPNGETLTSCFIGRDAATWHPGSFTGAIDEFRWYKSRVIGQSEVSNLYATQVSVGKFQNPSGGNPTWIAKPSVAVDSTETSYTVKSNEIALAPGVNSTYAVWTAPKSTNLKIDVSFADYNSRSAGVGFQMFKINNDNTFGSVIFPRTVTSTALTNAAPTNYLSVPSRTISVATGDKIYYRVDANGNTTAASSVLATAIYTDPNQDLKQYKYLQANLGNNIASTSFVAGNANVVNDTLGTGSWKFYVAGNTSIASITGSSASSEWTVGNLLSYTVPPTDFSIFYPLNIADINPGNPLQVGDLATGSYVYNSTLAGGATIAVDGNSRVAGQGYLSLNGTTGNTKFLTLPTITLTQSTGFSISLWTYIFSGNDGFIFDFRSASGNNNIAMGSYAINNSFVYYTDGYGNFILTSNNSYAGLYNKWNHICLTIKPNNFTTIYINSVSQYSGTPAGNAFAGDKVKTQARLGSTYLPNNGLGGGIDDFRIYNRELTSGEVSAIYSGSTGINDAATGATWMPTPGVPVDATETNYTVKSNEVALIPGTNSTYAVWTATKPTNLKIDVSFADYHTRSSGVGFQMFKIKSDNTFDSVLFPRTVTSTALTNANSSNSSNYLSVPTITTTVNVGDKLYYLIDGNGNAIAASSVLATSIYTDDVSVANNPVETKLLQAQLGNNLASATLVVGNSNTVLDTIGTGDWKFYVAGNTSTAAITSTSASSEWTVGNLLSYVSQSTPPTDMSFYYTMNTNTVSGSTVLDSVSGNYSATLGGTPIATISTTDPSPAPGQGHLSMVVASQQHLQLPSITFSVATGLTFACWFRSNNTLNFGRIMDFGSPFPDISNNFFIAINDSNVIVNVRLNNSGATYQVSTSGTNYNNNVWRHVVWTISTTGVWNVYIDGVNKALNYAGVYPKLMTRPSNLIGKSNWASQGDPYFNGAIDDFRIYYREISAADATAIYIGPIPASLKDTVTNTTWMSTPATAVDVSETLYTVKSNEIALAPGTNSTYAVWTAPKSTNLKIDVSFADYHSRSAGVGFQMFKINNDNTFGSVIFPRTVTGNALTNANSSNSSNYLSVPSRTISVATGDKIYYRVDANGNTTAASSVLATNIYVDTNQDFKQFKYLQAHLGNNLSAVSFVAGNANVVNDTLGTGNWNFYVGNTTSTAAISGASASSEWTGGTLLSYVPLQQTASNYAIYYTFNSNTSSGSTITDSVSNQVATLASGATTSTTAAQIKYGAGSLDLSTQGASTGVNAQHLKLPSFTISQSTGFSVSFWVYYTAIDNRYVFDFASGTVEASTTNMILQVESTGLYRLFPNFRHNPTSYTSDMNKAIINQWQHFCLTISTTGIIIVYVNSAVVIGPITTSVLFGSNLFGTKTIPVLGTLYLGNQGTKGYFDDFKIYHYELTASEVNGLYVGTVIPPIIKDTTDTFSKSIVQLYNGATYAANAGSRIAGKPYLQLNNPTTTNVKFASISPFVPTTTGLSIAFWIKHTNNVGNYTFIFNFRDANNSNQLFMNFRDPSILGFMGANINNTGSPTSTSTGITSSSVADGNWHHVAWTISYISLTNSTWKFYLDGTLITTITSKIYPNLVQRNFHNIGKFDNNVSDGEFVLNGGIDNFNIYQKVLTDAEVIADKDSTMPRATWMPTPGTVVDSSETNYTVKSNEIALLPGENSTYAVWTATKFTNLKIDVSFADYNSRSAGVGFQMFKIKSDNTFDSVLFPRTVTSTALTNANSSNSSNYLTVPSITTTVNVGDKLYYRVDANGNTIAASSVLATAIYTDDVSVAINPVETKLLQANLGNNLATATATLVAGNANAVYDTIGTGDWKFYVAGNTSIASVTGASASSEWITGNLLSYTLPSTPQNDFSMNFTFNTDKVSGTTITDSSVANYSATLVGVGATIATTTPSPAPGTGYLSILNTYSPSPVTTNHVALPPITPPTGGMTLSFWLNPRENRASYIIQIGNGQFNNNIMFFLGNNNMFGIVIKGGSQGPTVAMSSTDNINVTNGTWKHVVWTLNPSNQYKFYFNGSLTNTLTGAAYHYPNNVTTTQNYIGRSSYAVPYYNGDFDDFRIYNRVLSDNDAYSVFMAGAKSKFSDETTGATWIPIPGTVVDTSETSYTVKSNEIALAPGTRSTYAVWTAPKPTNIRIDVSFADYHSRSAGVGFQMFKINSDNTFGSVIFPRTVTSTALTNSNPTNYLSVPSKSLSVATGDKIYYRIDANGNTTAASSVLATNIYTYSGKWS